jgi:hypothetical protein
MITNFTKDEIFLVNFTLALRFHWLSGSRLHKSYREGGGIFIESSRGKYAVPKQMYMGANGLEGKFPSNTRKWWIISKIFWEISLQVTCSHIYVLGNLTRF